ncbi:MAG TPA: glyoxalase [Leeuwenhoekiella sp.]|nr:glyoxalase [Leeuwenhoekiella sp.]
MKNNKASIIPTMRYKNAPAAIKWLCEAFGFTKNLIVPGDNNKIVHAQLTFGNSMIMLGSENDNAFGKHVKTPQDVNGINTQTAYIIVPEIDSHYKNAIAHGAEIVLDIKDEIHGGRGYTCRDPEGYLWNFGSYDPCPEQS